MSRKAVIIDGRLYCGSGEATNASCWSAYDATMTPSSTTDVPSPVVEHTASTEKHGNSRPVPILPTPAATRSGLPGRGVRFANQVSSRPLQLAPINIRRSSTQPAASIAHHTFTDAPGTSTTIAWDRSRQLPRSRRESQQQGLHDRWQRIMRKLVNMQLKERLKGRFTS